MAKGAMQDSQADELVWAGFLSSFPVATPGTTLHMRPEDRTTLASIRRVSRFASGSVSVVGGVNATHLVGGGGQRTADSDPDSASDFHVSIPGHGRYLKLAAGAVD